MCWIGNWAIISSWNRLFVFCKMSLQTTYCCTVQHTCNTFHLAVVCFLEVFGVKNLCVCSIWDSTCIASLNLKPKEKSGLHSKKMSHSPIVSPLTWLLPLQWNSLSHPARRRTLLPRLVNRLQVSAFFFSFLFILLLLNRWFFFFFLVEFWLYVVEFLFHLLFSVFFLFILADRS